MSPLVPVLFNLLFNAVFSFVFALAFTALAQRILKLEPGALRLSLWLLPIAKVLWDLRRGVPAQSFVWVHALGAKQDLGYFQLGFGLERLSPPFVHAVLSARSGGTSYPQSAADLLYRACSMKLSPVVPAVVVAVALSVAALRLARRASSVLVLRQRARQYLASAQVYVHARGALRSVPVYVSEAYECVPFAAGVAHPCVLFSRRQLEAMPEAAREAAIAHELAHIERLDPLWILSLLAFSDLFWFLPGLRGLLGRILGEIELCADARAVGRGTAPEDLADALLRVGESLQPSPQPALGLTGEKSILRQRVERLCNPGPRLARWRRVAVSAAAALVFASVLCSVFFGN